ncbi:DUF294 nucleotidyltransferase-like domain-containing protein [Autumnicola psychrophila]|uniref:DUF294 nucleotidyltransferase-like domain-containing protein n=1 Tax=Autumnicola psychrophila TaxID=3075592 RepID=A0ABU3DWU0_9FLAO|nr:DUF294 nucleotidyltransferase-like domain-containing protein [Zunongwangia sp. F225]MDT0688108.1 DUF294 nucleotidyltransferase-like domain-containing protein [Zunongwangia sp. F225]
MKNTIAARIADFLKEFPPFSLLEEKQLLTISKDVKVIYMEKGKPVFRKGENGHEHFYIVNKGAIDLQKINENGEAETIDKCDEGDIFGLRPLFAKENYLINADTDEESILYAIPISIFKPIAENNSRVGNFLIESFASNTRNPYSPEHRGQLVTDNTVDFKTDAMYELQPVPIVKKIVTVPPETTIKTAANLMSNKKVGSILITENEIPIGIVTDMDFRKMVATGRLSIDTSVSEIMTSPVICYSRNITIAQAQLTMMKHNINHICITKDGTPNTRVKGIVSEHDIIVSQANNPSVLMKAIKRARSTKKLKKVRNKITQLLRGYLDHNIPLTHISKIFFELNDATIKRIIDRCIEKMETPPPVNFAWLSLGSQGRKEQLLHTDQDNALVFEDVPEEKLEETKEYFLKLSKKVTKRLSIIGYEFCPAEMMARNPDYCLSLKEWKEQFSDWIVEPGPDQILLCSIFFDYDISYGDVKLSNELADHIYKEIESYKKFLTLLAASALRNPTPLGFFRQFLVEHDGENKDFFDIKKRAITPLTDAGRVLSLLYQVKNISNTAERFEKLAQLEPANKELYLACSYSSKALLKFRTKQGLRHKDSGRFINLQDLSKEDKIKLKRCFKSIKDVQELIKFRFEISSYLP